MNREKKLQFLGDVYQNKAQTGGVKVTMSGRDLMLVVRCIDEMEELEEHWGSDIAEQAYTVTNSAVEIIADNMKNKNLFTGFNTDYQLCVAIATVLFLYNRWCRDNGYPATEDITRGKWIREARGIMWVVRDPEHLQSLLDEVLLSEDSISSDLVTRGVAWLSYVGMSNLELLNASCSDFNLESKTISVRRGDDIVHLRIPDEGIKSLSLLSSLDYFIRYTDHYHKGSAKVPRTNSDRLLRGKAYVRRRGDGTKGEQIIVENEVSFVVNALSKARGRWARQEWLLL